MIHLSCIFFFLPYWTILSYFILISIFYLVLLYFISRHVIKAILFKVVFNVLAAVTQKCAEIRKLSLIWSKTTLPRSLCDNNTTTDHFQPISVRPWCSLTDVSGSVIIGEKHGSAFDAVPLTARHQQVEKWQNLASRTFLLFSSDFVPSLRIRFALTAQLRTPAGLASPMGFLSV